MRQYADLEKLSTYVEDTGEVKWVLNWANDHDVTALSQAALPQYRDLGWPTAKAVALLRNQYGGHPLHVADEGRERR